MDAAPIPDDVKFHIVVFKCGRSLEAESEKANKNTIMKTAGNKKAFQSKANRPLDNPKRVAIRL